MLRNRIKIPGIQNKSITVGGFVVINAYMLQLYQPLNFLGTIYREIRQSLVDMENMFTLLNEKTEITDNIHAKDLIISDASVTFKNVSFHYDEKRKIIKDISFKIYPNQTVAIVGPTGAGKSTISKIFFRFFDPISGSILIDNQDIRKVTQKSLREQIAVVPQDTVLFNETLFYNISYGNPNSSKEEIVQVTKMAKLHDFIENLSLIHI